MVEIVEWIEIIRLRSIPKDVQMLRDSIREQLENMPKSAGLERVRVMLNAEYETDFAVVLVWKNDREPVKTREGLLLADCMQRYGSVDHAVWKILL